MTGRFGTLPIDQPFSFNAKLPEEEAERVAQQRKHVVLTRHQARHESPLQVAEDGQE